MSVASISYNSLVFSQPSPEQQMKDDEEKALSTRSKAIEAAKVKSSLHWPSLICIMSVGFIANCEYGIIMPSILGYIRSIGGDEKQFGVAVAAGSLAQMCFLPLFGLWSDKRSMREAITFSMIIGIAGNVLYACALLFQSPWVIVAGRTLTGIYMGVISVTNSFVAAVTTPETRTRFMAQINGINAIGMVSGPGFNTFLTSANFTVGPFVVDDRTSPGWFIAGLVSISFISFWILFREPRAPAVVARRELVNGISENPQQIQTEHTESALKRYMYFIASSIYKPYGACFIICFIQNFDFSVLETIATAITADYYGFGSFRNSLFYSALSVEMVLIIFITAFLSRTGVDDRIILLVAQGFVGAGSIGMLIFFPHHSLPFWQFCLFSALLIAGIPSQNIAVMSTYSKLLTAEYGQARQGLYTGIIMLFGSLARVLGPLWGGFETKHLKILFTLLVAMWSVDLLFTLIFFSKLKPDTKDEAEEKVSLLAGSH